MRDREVEDVLEGDQNSMHGQLILLEMMRFCLSHKRFDVVYRLEIRLIFSGA